MHTGIRALLHPRSGFSLVELLVTLAVVAILLGLLIPALGIIQHKAMRAEAVSNMRTIGQGMLIYTGEHLGRLPGPLWPGQIPEYDPTRSGRLVHELAPYLDIPTPNTPQLIELFIPPAYRRNADVPSLNTARTFVMNMAVEGDQGQVIVPWGNLADFANPGGQPGAISQVPSDAWAFSDADQLHPRVAPAPWSINTPTQIIHGDQRLAFFFGGRVGPIPEDDLQMP